MVFAELKILNFPHREFFRCARAIMSHTSLLIFVLSFVLACIVLLSLVGSNKNATMSFFFVLFRDDLTNANRTRELSTERKGACEHY